ncbi:CBS domain-containing protein [bacterium]|nr:CBS domain-containing protein [bacterium]
MPDKHTVADFMDRTFVQLKPEMKLSEALDILVKEQLIAALVVDSQSRPIGILSEKDCLKEVLHGGYNQRPLGTVRDYMHEAPKAVPSSMLTSELSQLFLNSDHRRFPVMDSGRLVGQITRRDLLRGYTKLMLKQDKSSIRK